MSNKLKNEFLRKDGSIDTKRAMEAGRVVRAEAFRDSLRALLDAVMRFGDIRKNGICGRFTKSKANFGRKAFKGWVNFR